jgi:hypothetical protein
MSMGPNPYAPGAGIPTSGMGPSPEVVKKAGNMQLMGILSIPIGLCCCPLIGIILSALVLTQAGGVMASIQQSGGNLELEGKVSTGKTCAIIGIVCSIVNMVGGVAIQMGGLLNQQ